VKTIKIFFLILFPSLLFGQGITLMKTISDSDYPEITWHTSIKIDTTAFQVYRAKVDNNQFNEIHTIHFANKTEGDDTLMFTVIDTSLLQKGLYIYYIEAVSNGNPVKSEKAYGHNFGILPRPQLAFFKSTPLDDRKAVKLDWKLNFKQTVSSLELFRSKNYDTGYIKITDLGPEMETFTDITPLANEAWFYYMVIHDYFGNQIPGVRIPAFATFAEKPIRPQNINGHFKNDTLHLNWANTGKNIIGYRVYRSINNKPFRLITEMVQELKGEVEFSDLSVELQKALNVNYYVRNVSDGFIESNSSDTLYFYLPEHGKILPPTELDQITDNDGNLKLLWKPSLESHTQAFNVYLVNPNMDTSRLNNTPLRQNFFVDTVYRTEGKYKYEIESIGIANKASQKRISTTVYRYKPQIHVIIDLKKRKDGLEISWKRALNKHVAKILLYKKYGNNKAVLKKSFSNEEDIVYLDTKVSRGNTYLYKLKAVMDNGDEIIINDGVEMNW
jgi:hypothetical protein